MSATGSLMCSLISRVPPVRVNQRVVPRLAFTNSPEGRSPRRTGPVGPPVAGLIGTRSVSSTISALRATMRRSSRGSSNRKSGSRGTMMSRFISFCANCLLADFTTERSTSEPSPGHTVTGSGLCGALTSTFMAAFPDRMAISRTRAERPVGCGEIDRQSRSARNQAAKHSLMVDANRSSSRPTSRARRSSPWATSKKPSRSAHVRYLFQASLHT